MEKVRFTYTPREYARGLRRYRLRAFHVVRDSLIAVTFVVFAGLFWDLGWPAWVIVGSAVFYFAVAFLSAVVWPVVAYRVRSQFHEPYTLGYDENEIAFSTPNVKQKKQKKNTVHRHNRF